MTILPKSIRELYYTTIKELLLKDKKAGFKLCELNDANYIFYGTFGYHDNEPPHSILSRKIVERKNNDFSLWGTTINDIGIEKIRKVAKECEANGHEVLCFLQFTNSTKQLNNQIDLSKAKQIWSIENILDEGKSFDLYIDADGKEHSLMLDEKGIIVKGKEEQSAAFVVEQYLWVDDMFDRNAFLQYFDGTIYNGNQEKSGELIRPYQCPCYILKRKKTMVFDEKSDISGKNWGIVLKLKTPYIVRCKSKND